MALPYIRDNKTVIYDCDGLKGSASFNGYFYVEDEEPSKEYLNKEIWDRPMRYSQWLPKKAILTVITKELEREVVNLEYGYTDEYYKTLYETTYMIEIYKRDLHESTNEYGELEDEGVAVCFFPTNRQTIYFRILETINK